MRCEGQYRALRCVRTRLVERSEGRRLFDKLRAGDVLVVRLVDRLGRNYDDVCETIRDFMRRGVVIKTVMNGMTFPQPRYYRDYDRPEYRAYGYDRGYRGCRTVTIERDDGSVRRVRRCD